MRELLIKELRESQAALTLGLLWIVWPLTFYASPHLPWWGQALVHSNGMMVSIGCVALLAFGRLLVERHTGTWDLLRSLPVPMWQVIFAKWGVALVVGSLCAALSSAMAYDPVGHVEETARSVPLIQWTLYHGAAMAFFISVLLFTDLIDWANHLIARASVTFLSLIGCLYAIFHSAGSNWLHTGLFAAGALTLFGIALTLSPLLRRDFALPAAILPTRAARTWPRRFSPRGAWQWLQWRHARPLWPLPTLFLLLLAAVEVAGFWIGGSADSWQTVFTAVLISMPMVALFAIHSGATLLGFVPKIIDESNAASFVRTLPLSHGTRERLRVLTALGLLVAACVIPLALIAVRDVWFREVSWTHTLAQCCEALLRASAILMLSLIGVSLLRGWGLVLILLPVAVTMTEQAGGLSAAFNLACLATVILGIALAPMLEVQREVVDGEARV